MELVPKAEFSIVTRASSKAWIPELIAAAGPEVTETYIDFFTATIRNRNTRAAYARACWQFFGWCASHGLELTTVRPFHVAARHPVVTFDSELRWRGPATRACAPSRYAFNAD
jgi:hypothetical protein